QARQAAAANQGAELERLLGNEDDQIGLLDQIEKLPLFRASARGQRMAVQLGAAGSVQHGLQLDVIVIGLFRGGYQDHAWRIADQSNEAGKQDGRALIGRQFTAGNDRAAISFGSGF